jgi:hypothetical protein
MSNDPHWTDGIRPIFLDELVVASPEVQAAMMGLILSQKIDRVDLRNISRDREMNSLVLSMKVDTCGQNSDGTWVYNPEWVKTLTPAERKQIAQHERMHIQYAILKRHRPGFGPATLQNPGEDIDRRLQFALIAIDELEAGTLVPGMETEGPPAPKEAPCRNVTCGRVNDVGSKKCWHCELDNPC